MTLKLSHIENAGNLETERVVFQAKSDLSLGKYLVLQGKKSPDGGVYSGIIPAAFWFITMDVKRDDIIVLYSKSGVQSQKQAVSEGSTSYFFYWGLSSAVWTAEFKPVAVLAATWEWTA